MALTAGLYGRSQTLTQSTSETMYAGSTNGTALGFEMKCTTGDVVVTINTRQGSLAVPLVAGEDWYAVVVPNGEAIQSMTALTSAASVSMDWRPIVLG